jgi:phosphohistidine phosphatase SixA
MNSDEEVKYTEFVFEDETLPDRIERAPKKTKRLLFVRDVCTVFSKINKNQPCSNLDDIPTLTLNKIKEFIVSSGCILDSSKDSNNLNDVYIISSPLLRAEMTAKMICKKLNIPNKKIKYHEYFREVKLNLSDFFEEEEIVFDTKETFRQRMRLMFEYLTKNIKEDNVIIVTHEKLISQLTEKINYPGDYFETEFDIF